MLALSELVQKLKCKPVPLGGCGSDRNSKSKHECTICAHTTFCVWDAPELFGTHQSKVKEHSQSHSWRFQAGIPRAPTASREQNCMDFEQLEKTRFAEQQRKNEGEAKEDAADAAECLEPEFDTQNKWLSQRNRSLDYFGQAKFIFKKIWTILDWSILPSFLLHTGFWLPACTVQLQAPCYRWRNCLEITGTFRWQITILPPQLMSLGPSIQSRSLYWMDWMAVLT